MQTIETILKAAKQILFAAAIDAKAQTYRDFCLLLTQLLNQNQTYLITNKNQLISAAKHQKIAKALSRLASNEPIELIKKKAIFKRLEFKVNRHTLIPRIETEILLNQAIKMINQQIDGGTKQPWIADLGTGSGILAIHLALHLQQKKQQGAIDGYQIIATDISKKALKVAQFNQQNLLTQARIQWIVSDWFSELERMFQPNSFDLILSNPPYIANNDKMVQASTQFEPQIALFSEEDGLSAIKKIIIAAKKHLKADGYLLLEHGFEQQKSIKQLLQYQNYYNTIGLKDHNQLNRVVASQLKL